MTLIEILTVMAIIAVVASLTLGLVSTLKTRAKRNATASLLNNLASALEDFRAFTLSYPPDDNGPVPTSESCFGIKNLRIALSGLYTCSSCRYIYDPCRNNMVAFRDLDPSWKCPCGAGKESFAKGRNYLEWLKPEQIGQGVRDIDLNHNGTIEAFGADDPRNEKDVNYVGAIMDAWGQPIVYDTFFNESNPEAWRSDGRQSQWPTDAELIKLSAGEWVLYSYGPD